VDWARVPEYLAATPVALSPVLVEWLEHLREQGHPALSFNVLTDPVPGGFQVILANAVFLHLTRPQLTDALRRLLTALADGSRLAFTVKQGDGEERSTEKLGVARYFCYWQPGPLHALVTAAGFASVRVTRWPTRSGQLFLAVIADVESSSFGDGNSSGRPSASH
jgi:hypothetical protein